MINRGKRKALIDKSKREHMQKQKTFFFTLFILVFIMLISCEEEISACDRNSDGIIDSREERKCQEKGVEKSPDKEPINESTGNEEEIQEEATEYIVRTAFISIHLEPGNDPETTEYPELHWPDLVNLIALADEYGVKLSLVFNPQWATYILADEEKITLLRSWEANGHEIGLHHHGPHHGSWNGYTNQEEYTDEREYIGTIEEMMELVNQLPASGRVLVAGIGGEEDVDSDWPKGVIYETDGGADGPADILSNPTENTYNGHTVMSLRHGQYQVGKMSLSLEEIESYLKESQSEEYMGIVFHEKNYAENPAKIEELFMLFRKYEVQVKTVQTIMEEEGY